MTDQTKQSQTATIIAFLRFGGTLTNAESRAMFGCDRLASRVNDAKKIIEKDEAIITVMVKIAHRKWIGRYHLTVKGFRHCCALTIKTIWQQSGGSMNVVHHETHCPGCAQYIGLTQTSEKEAGDFLSRFGIKTVTLPLCEPH